MNTQTPFDTQSDANVGDFLKRLFQADFMPHGHCFFWRSDILWLHVLSDLFITLAYYSIPLMLLYFVRKRRDVPFHFMFLMFGAFIFLCGTTHLVEIWTTWVPVYRLQGLVKALTALVSIGTAIKLIPIMPKAISFPSMESLVEELSEKGKSLAEVNENLEHFNRLAMGREERIIQLKREVNELSKALGRSTPYEVTP